MPTWDARELQEFLLARIMNEADVPCVFWGPRPIRHMGCDSGWGLYHFVVPDDLLEQAAAAISSKFPKIEPCPADETGEKISCEILWGNRRRHANRIPGWHGHLNRVYCDPLSIVMIYRQSEALWALPPIPRELSNPRTATLPDEYVFLSDPSVLPEPTVLWSSPAHEPDSYPLIMPKLHHWLESILRRFAWTVDDGHEERETELKFCGYMIDGFLELESGSWDTYVPGRSLDPELMTPPYPKLWQQAHRYPRINFLKMVRKVLGEGPYKDQPKKAISDVKEDQAEKAVSEVKEDQGEKAVSEVKEDQAEKVVSDEVKGV